MHKSELTALNELALVGCYLAVAAGLVWLLHIIGAYYV
jgi:hypothetical protein